MNKNKIIEESVSEHSTINWPAVTDAPNNVAVSWSRSALAKWAVQLIAEIRNDNAEFCAIYHETLLQNSAQITDSTPGPSRWYEWSYELMCLLVDYAKSKRDKEEFKYYEYIDENQISVLRYVGRISNGLWRIIHLIMTEYPECILDKQKLDFSIEEIVQHLKIEDGTNREVTSRLEGLKNTIYSILYEMSSEYPEAMYLLGLMDEPGDLWILKAADSKFLLATFRLMLDERVAMNAKEALKTIKRLRKIIDGIDENNNVDDIDEHTLNILKDSATETLINFLEEQIVSAEESAKKEQEAIAVAVNAKHQEEMARTQSEARKLTLAGFAHSIHNTLGTGPYFVKQAMRAFQPRTEQMTARELNSMHGLGALQAAFELTESMIESFKLQIDDPERLKRKVSERQPNIPTFEQVATQSLLQVLGRVVFYGNFLNSLQNIAGNPGNETIWNIRSTYPLDETELLLWIRDNLPGLKVNIIGDSIARPLHNETQRCMLFAMISEMMINALKHSNSRQTIDIDIIRKKTQTVLAVRNGIDTNLTFTESDSESDRGSGGLAFYKTLANNVTAPGFDVDVSWSGRDGIFESKLTLIEERN